jgi:oligopeptide transport system substrate-binding protein
MAAIRLLVPFLLLALSAQAADPSRTFTFRLLGEPETLDWNRAHTSVESYLMVNLMEGLVFLDQDLKAQPGLAKSWTKSADGRTYTFKLRPGVQWSDGVPLRAADFVYSWKRLLTPATAASYAYFLYDVDQAEEYFKGSVKDFSKVGIQAVDDQTLVVRLAKPVAHWIYIPSFWVTYPLRQDLVEKYGSQWTKPGKMVTVGPYVLAAHEPDTRIVLAPNPHYYGTRGNIEQVVGQIVKEDSTALTLYESGKIDFLTDIPGLDLKRLSDRPDLKAFPYLKTGYLGLVVNHQAVPLGVRKAIAMGIDKSRFAELLYGRQQAASSFVPPKMMGYSTKLGLPFNVAKAQAALRESGYDTSKPVEIQLLIPNWDKPVTMAQFIQGELKKNLGLNVTIQPFDHKTFRAQVDLRQFPSFILSWSADYPDPDNFLSLFLSDSGNNRTNWKNGVYDGLVLRARAASSGREKLYFDAQKLLLETDAVVVPLYYEPQMALVKPRAKGFALNPVNYMYLKQVNLGP